MQRDGFQAAACEDGVLGALSRRLDHLHQPRHAARLLDLRHGELDAELGFQRQHDADVAEAVPGRDVGTFGVEPDLIRRHVEHVGDHGDDLVLDNFFLSCRALQRGVEGAMLHALAQRAKQAGLRRIVGRVERLPRNEPARELLARHGFVEQDGKWFADLGLAAGPLAVVPEGIEIAGEPS